MAQVALATLGPHEASIRAPGCRGQDTTEHKTMRSAIREAFSIYELRDHILDHLEACYILSMQRVNTIFRDHIVNSPNLQSRLGLRALSSQASDSVGRFPWYLQVKHTEDETQ